MSFIFLIICGSFSLVSANDSNFTDYQNDNLMSLNQISICDSGAGATYDSSVGAGSDLSDGVSADYGSNFGDYDSVVSNSIENSENNDFGNYVSKNEDYSLKNDYSKSKLISDNISAYNSNNEYFMGFHSDNIATYGSNSGSFSDLKNDIFLAWNNQVNLSKDYKFDSNIDNEFINGIKINKTIVINGNYHLINGNNLAKLFVISTDCNFTINDLAIVNTKASNSSSGAAIFSYGGTVWVNNCNLSSNSAEEWGGVIIADIIHINKSIFINNSAKFGGAIYGDSLYMNNSLFVNNSAIDSGGAIFISGGFLEINNSNFIKNTAINSGGAIYGDYGIIISSNFSDNSANLAAAVRIENLDLKLSNFYNNSANTLGAGIVGDKINVLSSVFLNNYITSPNDGVGEIIFSDKLNISYSYIVNKLSNSKSLMSFSSSIYMDYNYWGTNNPFNLSNICFNSYTQSYVKANNWILLKVFSLNSIGFNKEFPIVISLANLNNGLKLNSNLLPNYELAISSVFNNSLNTSSIIVQKGIAKISYWSSNIQGIDNLNISDKYSNLCGFNISITNNLGLTEIIANDSVANFTDILSFKINSNSTINSGIVEISNNGFLISRINVFGNNLNFNLTNLNPGKNNLTIYYLGNNNFEGSYKNITVEIKDKSSIISANDFKEVYGAEKYFTVKLTDAFNNPLANSKITLVLSNSLGGTKTYTKFTDDQGMVNLFIKLVIGNYSIKYSFEGNENFSKSESKSNLIISPVYARFSPDLYNESYGASKNFTVKFLSLDGNPIVGAELPLRLINYLNQSKVYWRTTNTEGIAKLTINLIPNLWYIECTYPNFNYVVNTAYGTVIVNSLT